MPIASADCKLSRINQGTLRKGTAAYRRAALAMFLAGFSTFSLLYWPQSLLPLMARTWAVTPAAASTLIALGTLAMAVMLIPASLLSDRFGRKNVMSLAMLLAALFTLAMAFVTSFHSLLILRFMTGLVLAGLPAVAITYLSEEVESGALASAIGLYISGTAFGGMSGRLLSAWAAAIWGSAGAALVVGIAGLLAAMCFLYCLPASQQFRSRLLPLSREGREVWRLALLQLLRDPVLRMLWAMGFLFLGCFVGLYNFIGFRLERPPFSWAPLALGAIFLLYLFGGAASAASGRMARRWGLVPALQAMWLTLMIGVLCTLSDSRFLLLAGMALFTLAFFAGHALASSAVGSRAQGHQALAAAIYLCCYYAGASVLGPLLGWAWHAQQWPAVVAVLMAASFIGLCLTSRLGQPGILHYAYAAFHKGLP